MNPSRWVLAIALGFTSWVAAQQDPPAPENLSRENAALLDFVTEKVIVPAFDQTPEQWWRWTSPHEGTLSITSPFATVAIYDASQVFEGQEIQATAGKDYWVQVSAENPVEVAFRFDALAVNDLFANATDLGNEETITLAGPFPATGFEDGESTYFPNENGGSLWWQWTAPKDGQVILSGASAFQGDDFASLRRWWFSKKKVKVFGVRLGERYWIGVAGSGRYAVSLDIRPIQPNTRFDDAIDLGSGREFIYESPLPFRGGFTEPGEPVLTTAPRSTWGVSYWWQWAAPEDLSVELYLKLDGLNLLSAVFTGESLTELQEIISRSNNGRLRFEAVKGTAYRFFVAGQLSNRYTYYHSIELRSALPGALTNESRSRDDALQVVG